MPNIADVLRGEIRRLAQKEAKIAMAELKKENTELRRLVSEMKRRLDQVERTASGGEDTRSYVTQLNDARVRITGQMILGMRERFALTQAELAHLLDVSAQSVYQWERNLGSLNLRQRTLNAVLEVRDMGKREVRKRLEQAGLLSERRRGPIARGSKSSADDGDNLADTPGPQKKRAPARKKSTAKRKTAAKKKAAAGPKRGPGRPKGSGKKTTA